MRSSRRFTRRRTFPIGDRTLREELIDGVSLSPAPDMLFQLFSYISGGERKQKAKRLASGEDPDGDAATIDVLAALHKFSEPAARSGSLHRSARSAAAAGLFDLVVAEIRSRPRLADGRRGTLRDRQAHPARRLLDLPRRPHRAGRQGQGLCAEGAALRAARGSGEADHHDRARAPASRHSAPSCATA